MRETQKIWEMIIFEKEKQVFENREIISDILMNNNYTFIDREYSHYHRIRIRGIQQKNEESLKILRSIINSKREEDNPLRLFQNQDQFKLYCKIHHDLDIIWYPYFFKNNGPIDEIISFARMLGKCLSVNKDEGYISHLSHFWGFFHFIEEQQQEGIAKFFQRRYEQLKLIETDKFIDTKTYLLDIESLLEKKKIDFYSPNTLDEILNRNQFASKLHEKTVRNADRLDFLYSKYNICSKWVLNALYVVMILMNIPVIDRFFLNYSVAMEKYPMDEICHHYIRTGEEKLWMRE